ncbi:MAG: carbonic anhydrase [Patescibacteria group bacterium]|nr:carbonic anhydrase [Patescibacteria group bacterium]
MHRADAIVIACIDFRFQDYIHQWLEENMNGKTYDYVGYAGSTKDLETIIKQIDIAVRLHQVKQVIVIHHEECGAYGAASTPEKHAQDMNKTKMRILSSYPDLRVERYYLHLDGEFERLK